jgi:hypothetical protein
VFECLNVSQWLFTSGNFTQTGSSCSLPNCTSWTQGLVWPTIGDDGSVVNGGVPQAGNLSLHLDTVRQTVVQWLPDPDYDGNAVIDFESWTPLWDQNNGSDWYHGVRYQKLSIALVAAAHPSWNATG